MTTCCPAPDLATTPLHRLHISLGARLAPFAGHELPVHYPGGLIAEHLHTRTQASLFDVSHMGQISVSGPDAAEALEGLMPVDLVGLPAGRLRYGLLLDDQGCILDDLLIVNRGGDFLLVVNAACAAADVAHIAARIGHRCRVTLLADHAMLALQGPAAAAVLKRLLPGTECLAFMTGAHFLWQGARLFVTRSGYTGEDGFEVSLEADRAVDFARAVLGEPEAKPAGLGARNSLRVEAGLCLFGQDIDPLSTPVEAGLGWAIAAARRPGGPRAGGFPAAARVLGQLATAPVRMRVGLIGLERVPVREQAAVVDVVGRSVGEVTSGLLSPSLDRPIAMARIRAEHAAVGTRLEAVVRGRGVPMEVCPLPFVPHRHHRAVQA